MCCLLEVCERRVPEAARAPAPGANRPFGRNRPSPPIVLSSKYKPVWLFDAASDFKYYTCAQLSKCVSYSRYASAERLKTRGLRLRGRNVLVAPPIVLPSTIQSSSTRPRPIVKITRVPSSPHVSPTQGMHAQSTRSRAGSDSGGGSTFRPDSTQSTHRFTKDKLV